MSCAETLVIFFVSALCGNVRKELGLVLTLVLNADANTTSKQKLLTTTYNLLVLSCL